eukprot:3056117-Pyramimonas_sp.AAC.2
MTSLSQVPNGAPAARAAASAPLDGRDLAPRGAPRRASQPPAADESASGGLGGRTGGREEKEEAREELDSRRSEECE